MTKIDPTELAARITQQEGEAESWAYWLGLRDLALDARDTILAQAARIERYQAALREVEDCGNLAAIHIAHVALSQGTPDD